MRLIKVSQFLQQFKLDIRHKPEKQHIIPNALSRLTNTNIGLADSDYLELDTLFMYNITVIEIHPTLVSQILIRYKANNYLSHLQHQIQVNNKLGPNKALLPFFTRLSQVSDTDSYRNFCLEVAPREPLPRHSKASDVMQ